MALYMCAAVLLCSCAGPTASAAQWGHSLAAGNSTNVLRSRFVASMVPAADSADAGVLGRAAAELAGALDTDGFWPVSFGPTFPAFPVGARSSSTQCTAVHNSIPPYLPTVTLTVI